MKIEEIERLAVAATARILYGEYPQTTEVSVSVWKSVYQRLLAEFIEQEKAQYAAQPKD